jgi:hypothetical protein
MKHKPDLDRSKGQLSKRSGLYTYDVMVIHLSGEFLLLSPVYANHTLVRERQYFFRSAFRPLSQD